MHRLGRDRTLQTKRLSLKTKMADARIREIGWSGAVSGLTFGNVSLPADGGKRNIGGEEKGEANNNEDSDNDKSDIREESGLLFFIRNWCTIAGSGCAIRRCGLFITGSGCAIGGSWGSVRGSGCGCAVGRGRGAVAGSGSGGGGSVGVVVSAGSVTFGDFLLQLGGFGQRSAHKRNSADCCFSEHCWIFCVLFLVTEKRKAKHHL